MALVCGLSNVLSWSHVGGKAGRRGGRILLGHVEGDMPVSIQGEVCSWMCEPGLGTQLGSHWSVHRINSSCPG